MLNVVFLFRGFVFTANRFTSRTYSPSNLTKTTKCTGAHGFSNFFGLPAEIRWRIPSVSAGHGHADVQWHTDPNAKPSAPSLGRSGKGHPLGDPIVLVRVGSRHHSPRHHLLFTRSTFESLQTWKKLDPSAPAFSRRSRWCLWTYSKKCKVIWSI